MPSVPDNASARILSQAELGAQDIDTIKQGGMDSIVLWLLSLFAFIVPTDFRFSDEKSIAMRIGYACLLLGILGLLKRRTVVIPMLGFWVLAGFVAWCSCTLAWAEYPGAAQHKVLLYWALFLVTAIIPQYAWTRDGRAMLMDAYVLGCWLGVIGTAVNFWTGAQYSASGPADLENRYSFGTDPNYLALSLVIGMPLAFYRLAHAKSWWRRIPHLLYTPAAIVGVAFTGSRGALMALITVLLAYAVLSPRKTRALILGSMVVCLLAIWLSPAQLSERFSTIPDELRHGTLSDRRDLWDRGERVVSEHPIEGIGAGATTGKLDIAAHNTPLELMMEGGAVSLSLFYGAMLLGIIRLWKRDRDEGVVMTVVCAAWLVGTFSLSWEVNTVTWFIFTMLFSAGSPRSISALPLAARLRTAESA
jgi:O-antigen ligase